MEQDTRNIRDEFKGLDVNDIKYVLSERRRPFMFLCENIDGDFNFSSVVRTCNAFCAGGIIFVGRKKWDRRGAVGTHNYEDILHFPEITEPANILKDEGYMFVAAETGTGSISLPNFPWPEKVVLMLGEEQRGLSESALAVADAKVEIPQFGTVPSLNVANAAGIITYDYMLKRGRFNG